MSKQAFALDTKTITGLSRNSSTFQTILSVLVQQMSAACHLAQTERLIPTSERRQTDTEEGTDRWNSDKSQSRNPAAVHGSIPFSLCCQVLPCFGRLFDGMYVEVS